MARLCDRYLAGFGPATRVVSPKNGDVVPTFLVDGYVADKWRHEGDRVRLEPFAPLPRRVKEPLEAEARRLAAFLGRYRQAGRE